VITWHYHENVRSEHHDFEEGVDLFNQVLNEAKFNLGQELNDFSKHLDDVEIGKGVDLVINLDDDHKAICLLNEDRLVYWTNNKFPVDELSGLKTGIHKLKNGWYYVSTKKIDDEHQLFGLYQIKKGFKQENQYLKNSFNDLIGLNKDWNLVPDSSDASYASLIQKGESPVFLTLERDFAHGSHHIVALIEVISVISILLGIFLLFKREALIIKFIGVLLFIGLRLVLLYTSIGANYKEIKLFQPELYAASDFSPSFGDLMWHLIFLGFIVKLLSKHKTADLRRTVLSKLYDLGSLMLVFVFGVMISSIVESLIKNSIVPLDLNDVSTLNNYSFFVLLFLSSTVYGFYVFTQHVFRRLFESISFTKLSLVIVIISAICFAVSVTSIPFDMSIISWLWIVPMCFLIVFKLNRKTKGGFSLLHYFPEMLLFSVLFTFHMQSVKDTKESNTISQILERESQERDPIAEFLILKSSNKILASLDDKTLDSAQVVDLLTSKNLSKYLNKFDVSWSLEEVGNKDQTDNVKTGDHSSYTKINDFLFRKMTHGSMSYLTKIPVREKELSILFTAKEIPIDQGFPMLLASKSIEKMALDQRYSFAKYKDGKLIGSKGKYAYETVTSYFLTAGSIEKQGLEEKILDGVKHSILFKNGNVYVLTKDANHYLSLVANLSYMLFFLSIVLFFGGVLYRLFKEKVLFPKDFKSRLQYAILFILFFSTLVIALGSVYFLNNQYNKENFEAISEKIKSVDLALKLEVNSGQKDHFKQDKLNDLARTFFTDINLYDQHGVLVQTSQSNIFEAGVLSTIQNPVAFREIFNKNKAIFVQIEHIEDMNYLSAYVPLYGDNEHLIGCLNLPYFAKTDELQSEINGFMVALINMYLLLTVLSIVIALVISERIVKPLQIIQSKIANFNLKDTPEQIAWETNDEIGSLVKEYNRMVNELSESALRLAQAEREGAWKEMAQQVAHEIKNPLTPMKLNIQHFQMKWSSLEEKDRKEEFAELTRNLVEQIDTLSAIAEQFSNFATIPEPNLGSVDLIAILKSSTGIYDGSNEVEVKCEVATKESIITADKDQLLRIFNNVIKNAIQSVPTEIKGLVKVFVTAENKNIVVTITDNGSGISEDQKALIFQPNFTTKTSGMGLGLAMVKKMLESVNATISFESEVGVGTTFTLAFQLD